MSTPESEQPVCEQCGGPLARHMGDGLCSRCVARFSLREDTEGEEQGAAGVGASSAADGQRPLASGERPEGTRFGDYELLEEIARGGMGVVYRARQLSLNRVVAVKMVLFGQFAGEHAFERFRAEAETIARLQHPNIVAIHEIGETHGQPYFSMDYVAGRSLAELVRDRPMPARQAAEYVRKIARAVQYAHTQGVLHRDLKPANVLIDEADEPRITDFGLARRLTGDSELTLTGQVVGSPNFMPPEQGLGKKVKLGPTSDVYGLGAILYYLLTARAPFVAETFEATLSQVLNNEPATPRTLNPGLPSDLEVICLKCLEKDPARRYATAAQLADELDRFLKGEPIQARRIGPIGKLGRWCRRKPALAGTGAVALMALLAVSSIAIWRIEKARRKEDLERYAANIGMADRYLREGSTDLAVDFLMKCPERLRHWEWGRLLFESLQEVSTIIAQTNRPGLPLKAPIEEFTLSTDAATLCTRGSEGRLAVWDTLQERRCFLTGDATNRVTAAAMHPDRKEIAVARLDGSLEILDTDSGKVITRVIAPVPVQANSPTDPISFHGWSQVGAPPVRDVFVNRPWAVDLLQWGADRLLIKSVGGAIKIRQVGGAAREWTWADSETNRATKAWFTPDNLAVVVQTSSNAVVLNAATGLELERLKWKPEDGTATVSPNGRRVVLIDPQGQATLRGPRGQLAHLGQLMRRNLNAPLLAFFSGDGSLFCTTGDVGTARVFRSESGELLFPLPGTVYGGAFSFGGEQLAVFGMDRVVHLWEVKHHVELCQLRGHRSSVNQVMYARDGRLLATASQDGVVKLWSPQNHGRVICDTDLCPGSGISPDGKWLATSPWFDGLRLWEAPTGRLKWRVATRTVTAFSLAFSPDSRLLYTSGSDRCARIYNVADGSPAGMLRGHQRPVYALACSGDGLQVATADLAGTVKIWDARSHTEKLSFQASPYYIFSISFDARGQRLLTAGGGRPRIWDISSGRLIAELETPGNRVWAAGFSPDGTQAVACCVDDQIRIWEVPSGRLRAKWPSQSRGGVGVSYTPDGQRLLTEAGDVEFGGTSEPKLEIWDAEQGRTLLSLVGHRELLYSARFDSTGLKLVTSSIDKTTRQWEAFPWRDSDYPEPHGAALAERARRYAKSYWRQRALGTNAAPLGEPRIPEPGLPPGIPPWERDRWPQRDPALGPEQINLDGAYTGVLDAVFYPSYTETEWDDDLSELPAGRQRFGGIWFDVRGVVWLKSDPVRFSGYPLFPNRVDRIAVGCAFKKLHVLHGAGHHGAPDPGVRTDSQGNPLRISSYVLHYADGATHDFDTLYGRDVRNWWWGGPGDREADVDRAKMVWVGENNPSRHYEAKIRLFMSTFENPRPDEEVVSIDFVSHRSVYSPFLVAMTVEP